MKHDTTRKEKDAMGSMEVPEEALYGASTQRAVENFAISGHKMPEGFIRGMGLLKYACADVNAKLGGLPQEKAEWIKKAAWEVFEGKLSEHFPVDIFQTGSCTSSNMNVNEVIANRVSAMTGQPIGSKKPVHPNDDVNLGQSSNDTMPTVLHISVVLVLKEKLLPALEVLHAALDKKVHAFQDVVKIGRTHLMDATPLTLGQEFSGYSAQIKKGIARIHKAIQALSELAIGGTAVGTGINCQAGFAKQVIEVINDKTGMSFREAQNHFEAQAARDDCVEVAGYLTVVAASLAKIANDIRLMGSGPRSGLCEISIAPTQPGSSIMPGKVNPVMSEMLVQVALYATGLCSMVSNAGREGQFELNVTIPLMAYALHEAIHSLSHGARVFAEKCVMGITANEQRCQELVQRSLMLVTALNPYIGYDKASYVAKKAFAENKTLRDVVLEEELMDEETLDKALNPRSMV